MQVLEYEYFETSGDLQKFVNTNNINKSDIISIHYTNDKYEYRWFLWYFKYTEEE